MWSINVITSFLRNSDTKWFRGSQSTWLESLTMFLLSPRRKPSSGMKSATSRARQIFAGAVLAAFGMLAVVGFLLVKERQHALDLARSSSINLLTVVERELARNVEFYAMSLQIIVDGMQQEDVANLPLAMRERVLFERAIMAKHVSSAFVTDETGQILAALGLRGPSRLSISDREYFILHSRHTDVGLHLSQPLISRHGNRESIVFSRRLNDVNGGFAGVAAITIDLSYLHDLLAGLNLGADSVAELVMRDGVILTRSPPAPNPSAGTDLSIITLFENTYARSEGWFDARSVVDDTWRQYVFREVPGLPLMVVIGQAHETVLRDWRMRAIALGGLMAGLVAVMLWLVRRTMAELDGRVRAEQELQRLVTQDPLTGLLNRRGFDQILDAAWPAGETGRMVSLLFVDVDHFKAFNDAYGHRRGDTVLAEVAMLLRECVAGVGQAARYGGEEFVLVLPDSDQAAALAVAERVRDSLAVRNIVHVRGLGRRLTVSIGIACSDQPRIGHAAALIEAADQALYVAKAMGRDRAVTYAAPAQSSPDQAVMA